jgi:shikimate 5-dehydrogenase
MGYPIEKINRDTKLYSIIGVRAIEEKYDVLFNRYFKELDVNCRVMGLNIRTEDFSFFMNGLKDSQIKAVIFSKEYQEIAKELSDEISKESEICGFCDIVKIENNKNRADILQGEAIVSLIKDRVTINEAKIVIYGNTPVMKSLLYNLLEENPHEVILCDKVIENTISLSEIYPKADIYRVENKIEISDIDIFIDSSSGMEIKSTPKLNLNLEKDTKVILEKVAQIITKEWSKDG